MADTKPAAPVNTPPAAEPPKDGAKEASTVTAPEPQSDVAKRIHSDKEAKIERITKLLERLTNAQLDSVYQYTNNQANPTPR